MTHTARTKSAGLAVVAAAALAASALARPAAAQNVYTWTAPNSDNWSTGFTPGPPVSDFGTQLAFIPGTYTANNDLGPFNLNGITFNNSPDTNLVTVAGFNTLTFGGTNPNITVNGGSATFVSQIATGTAGLQVTNRAAGTLTLNSLNLGTGAVTITNAGAGITQLTDSYNNGPVYFGQNVVLNLANTGTGQLLIGNVGPSTAILNSGLGGVVNVTAGAVAFNGSTSGDLFGNTLVLNVAAGASFNFNSNPEGFGGISGAGTIIEGTAGMTLVEPGNRTFSGNITGTGTLTQNSPGTLTIGAANALSPNAVLSVTNGTVALGGFSQTVAGLSGGNATGSLALGTSTLTINPLAGTSYTYGVGLTGGGNVVLGGPGTEQLLGNNTYFGTTAVNAGTLRLNVGGLLAAGGSESTAAGATLIAVVPADASAGSYFNGTGAFVKEGTGNLTFNATNANFAPSAVTVAAGTVTLNQTADAGVKLGSPTVPLTLGSGTLAVVGGGASAGTVTFGGLTLGGPGTTGGSGRVVATNATVDLGPIARPVGGGGSVDFAPTNAGDAVDTTTANNATTGILGGYATYAAASWAVAGTGGAVAPLAAASYTANSFNTSTHTDVTAGFAPASGSKTYDVRFNTPVAATVTLAGTNQLASGGILVTAAVGANATNLSAGTITAPANTDLFVHQYDTAAPLTIASVLGNTAGTATTAANVTTVASTTVTVPSTAGLFVGELVAGTNVSSGTRVAAITSPTTITVSTATTNSSSPVTLTFTPNTSLVKAGPGTLTLTASNTYAGATYLNGGTLLLPNAVSANLGATASPLFINGGTLSIPAGSLSLSTTTHPITVGPAGATFDFAAAQTIQGNGLSGTGTIVKTAAGQLSVGSNASTFSGNIVLNGGSLRETSSQLGRATGLTLANGTAFQITDDATANFGIAVGAPVVFAGGVGPAGSANPGALVLTDQTPTNPPGISPNTTFTNPFTFLADTTIGVYNGSATRTAQLNLPNAITGTGNLIKVGTGNLVLSSPSNAFGNGGASVVIANGTLQIGVDNAVPVASVLQLGQTGATTSGTFDLGGFNQAVAGFSTAGSGTADVVINSSTTAVPTLTVNAAAGTTQTFAGALGGSNGSIYNPTGNNFALVKAGAGTLTLTGPNTFAGQATVSAGALRVVGGGNNLARPYAVADGATLIVANTDPNGPLQATTLTVGNAGTSTLAFELDDGTPGSNGALAVTTPNGLTLNGKVAVSVATAGTPLSVGTFPLISYAGSLQGAGFAAFGPLGLQSRAIGTLVNDTANHTVDLSITGVDFVKYTGAVNGNWDVNATANFKLNSSGAATTYMDVPSPDTVVFDDAATGTHTVNLTTTLQPASVTVNSAAGYTFAGTGSLAGTTGLTVGGPGTLTLLTNNAYTGTTTINGGTLAVGNGGTAGSLGTGPVLDNAQLTFNRTDAVTVAGNVTGTGSVTAAGTGALTLAGTDAIGGNLTVTAGSLAVTGTTAVGGAIAGPGTITVNAGGLSVNGTIAADIALTNSGTLTFNNANGVTDANAVTGAGNLVVAGGSAKLTGTVNYTGLTTLGTNAIEYGSNANTTIGNSITGTGTIVKSGAGTLFLLGSSNGFTGTLLVNAGAVVLDDLGASGDLGASSVVVNNGASFTFGPDNNPDFPDTTIVTVNAGGTFTLGVGESYGGIVLDGGTYTSGNANAGAGTTAVVGYTFNSGTVTTTGTGASALGGTVNLDKDTDGTVTFAGAATVGATVSINVHQGTLAFGTPNFPATGTTSITLGDNGTVGTLALTDGGAAKTVRPVTLAGNGGVVSIPNAAGSIAFNSPVGGNAPLTLTGAGTLTLGAANSYTGDTTVNGGTLVVGPAGTLPGNLIVNAGGTAAFAPPTNASTGPLVRTTGNVTVAAGGAVALTVGAAGRSLLVTPSLALAGAFDVGGNDLDVQNGNLSALTASAAAGYAGGRLNGPTGLFSTAAALDARRLTTVGVIANNDGAGNPLFGGSLGSFDGTTPAATDVLVRYTYFGDANLDGKVDGADYARVDVGFLARGGLTGWYNGDFNYDGKVDASDYTLIDNAFNLQAAPLVTSAAPGLAAAATDEIAPVVGASAVPEPASVAVLAIGAAALLGRRRRA